MDVSFLISQTAVDTAPAFDKPAGACRKIKAKSKYQSAVAYAQGQDAHASRKLRPLHLKPLNPR